MRYKHTGHAEGHGRFLSMVGANGAHETLGTRGSVSEALLLGDLDTLCRAGCRTTRCASQLTFWKAAHLPGWGQRPPQGRRDPRGQGWCPCVQA